MTAGVEYYWTDSSKRSLKLPAPQYIDYVMTWLQNQLLDESVFPTKADGEFPKEFISIVRIIFKQLFRIMAHIYYSHFDKILQMSAEAHLNTLTAHLLCFIREFDLVERKELAPLQDLMDEFEALNRI